jgi:hypothetical protein
MRIAILTVLLAACGDNIRPDDDLNVHPDIPPISGDLQPGGGCADFDINVTCPDAPVDAVPELDDETKAACCHALIDGTPPKHECGYPPGLCKNGRKTMFCKTPDGADVQFELCNP